MYDGRQMCAVMNEIHAVMPDKFVYDERQIGAVMNFLFLISKIQDTSYIFRI